VEPETVDLNMSHIFAASVLVLTNLTTGDIYSGTLDSGAFASMSVYQTFFAGFTMIMTAGIISAGVRWWRKLIGTSSTEEND
jgi:hypothetical protein